jgi:hypothetical protein
MGTWGTSIFADDTAAEVRDDYRDLVASGASDYEAREQITKKHLEVSEELRKIIEPVFWLALARAQWEIGRLDEETKSKAIAIIDSGQDIEQWRALDASKSDLKKRAAALEVLRRQLISEQRSRKQLRPRKNRVSPYQVGDVVRFTLSTGRFVLFRITSIHRDRNDEYPVAAILDWVGTSLPSETELAALPLRQRIKADGWASVRYPRILLTETPRHGFDANRLAIIASGIPMPKVASESFTNYPWPDLEDALARDFGLY